MAQKDFGKFLSGLANSASPASADTIKALQEKMEKEKQSQLEAKLRRVFVDMERQVAMLRALRAQEKIVKAEMVRLETKANKLVAGEDDEGDTIFHAARH